MQFKIKDISVKISFSFLALILFVLVTGKSNIYLITIFSATIHELTHIFFIYAFSGKITSITISVFGGEIKRKSSLVISNFREAVISVTAPVVNILLAVLFYFFNVEFTQFCQINLFMGITNLLPFYTFDGGRFLNYMLLIRFSEDKTDILITLVSILIVMFISTLTVFMIVSGYVNYAFVIFCLYMIIALLLKK